MKIFIIISNFLLLYFCSPVNCQENWALEELNRFLIDSKQSQFGGLSGIIISNSGLNFTILSDKGDYFEGELIRTNNGDISNLKIRSSGHLLSSNGLPLKDKNVDSESIVKDSNNTFFISFESNNRIMSHKTLKSPGKFLPKHKDFKGLNYNKGLEALALNEDGDLFAIPEKPPDGYLKYPIYKLVDEDWIIFSTFNPERNFHISDAAFLSNTELLVLERSFNWSLGFILRIRLLTFKKNEIIKDHILTETTSGAYNHEGLAIWKNDIGEIMLTLISDNNFLPFLKSEIREYKLVEIN